jgi:hypothetical protein
MKEESRKYIVQHALALINEELRKDWTSNEIDVGRNIIIPWSWFAITPDILKPYRSKGWLIKMSAVLDGKSRQISLNFLNPVWNSTVKNISNVS